MNPQNIHILKRDGKTMVHFDPERIAVCISKATNDKRYIKLVPEMSESDIKDVVSAVHETMTSRYAESSKNHLHVEEVQDIVVMVLIKFNYFKTAQSYIIYRHMRNLARNSADRKFVLVSSSHKAPSIRCPECDTMGTLEKTDANIMATWGSDKLLMEMNLSISGRDDIPQATSDIGDELSKLRAELENGDRKFHIRLEVEELK